MMMKKAALLFAVAAGVAGLAVSHADARSHHVRSVAPSAATGAPLSPNVGGALGYAPGTAYDGGSPGYNGPANDSYDIGGPDGRHLDRSYPG